MMMVLNVAEHGLPLPAFRQRGQLLVLCSLTSVKNVDIDVERILERQAGVQHVQTHL